MVVGFDIDDVLYPWVPIVHRTVLRELNIDLPPLTRFSEWEIYPDAWNWLWQEHVQLEIISHFHRVIKGMKGVVRHIAEAGHEVHFVTHRKQPEYSTLPTAKFLERHFGHFPWGGVHVLSPHMPKAELMDWDVFVDDKSETIRDVLHRTDAMCFAPARTWNVDLEGYGDGRLVRYTDPWAIAKWVDFPA